MNTLDAIRNELRDADMAARPVAWIRITTAAVQGSPTAVPISAETARLIAVRARPDGCVEADPEVAGWLTEILVHPLDWEDVLLAKVNGRYITSPIGRVLGLEVRHPGDPVRAAA